VDAAKMIHSCPQTPDQVSKTDTLNGLWNTSVSYADDKDVTMLCTRSRKVNTFVVPKVVNNAAAALEKSAKNYERSLSLIYRGGYCNIMKDTHGVKRNTLYSSTTRLQLSFEL